MVVATMSCLWWADPNAVSGPCSFLIGTALLSTGLFIIGRRERPDSWYAA